MPVMDGLEATALIRKKEKVVQAEDITRDVKRHSGVPVLTDSHGSYCRAALQNTAGLQIGAN
jgi:hypothetical protein